VLAVLGDVELARAELSQAAALSRAVEVRALVACAHAVRQDSEPSALEAFEAADRLNVWDPFVCTARAKPTFVEKLVEMEQCLPRLRALLRRCDDFDLARHIGLEIGVRPRSARASLSARESEVLQLIRQGLTNRQIASILFISEATVKVHVRHILEKFGARTRTEAATQRDFDE
jgi:ATP/maltotriose-dependent transcriptional regulator MalT